jgi:hypothetical protein
MTDYNIPIYCFFDDYLKVSRLKEDSSRKVNDAAIINTAILAVQYFHSNFTSASKYLQQHHGVRKLDKSNFNRYLNRLSSVLSTIFFTLGQSLKELNTESKYFIDSFPVAVCKNIRIRRNQLLGHEAYRGYNASKREFFYGFKVQVITTAHGVPVEYLIVAGSVHDSTAFQAMNIDLPDGSELYGDSAYGCYEIEDLYKECQGIHLLMERKKNSKRKDTPAEAFIKKNWLKRIQTTFSEITAFFPMRIHALTPQGFLLKLLTFIFAYTRIGITIRLIVMAYIFGEKMERKMVKLTWRSEYYSTIRQNMLV